MSPIDETELQRLTDMLRDIDGKLEGSSPLREGLVKAGLALHRVFMDGKREDLERTFSSLEMPLTEAETAHLKSLGIE
jgi:hypothetical protein